jgi:hypothetical protein
MGFRMEKTAHLSLRLDPQLKAAAERAASEDQRSVSALIEMLLANYCQNRKLLLSRFSERGRR